MQNYQNKHRCCPFEFESKSLSEFSLKRSTYGFVYPKLPLVMDILLTPPMSKHGPSISYQPTQKFTSFEAFAFRSSNELHLFLT